jgi:HEPN domain-containing protein
MQNRDLARDYVRRSQARLRALDTLVGEESWADVVREAQEIVELALKGMLRQAGVEPPHWHDVGGLLRQHAERLSGVGAEEIDRLARGSAWLRKEREFAFYGDIDFLPTEQYDAATAQRAIDDARFAVDCAGRVIPTP